MDKDIIIGDLQSIEFPCHMCDKKALYSFTVTTRITYGGTVKGNNYLVEMMEHMYNAPSTQTVGIYVCSKECKALYLFKMDLA